jgi:hypothetical protein
VIKPTYYYYYYFCLFSNSKILGKIMTYMKNGKKKMQEKKWKILCLTLYGMDINCIKFLFSTIIIGLIIGSLKQGPESEYCKILQGHNVVYLH